VQSVAEMLPYGKVTVSAKPGGLSIPNDDGTDPIVIANAGVKVYLADA